VSQGSDQADSSGSVDQGTRTCIAQSSRERVSGLTKSVRDQKMAEVQLREFPELLAGLFAQRAR
jgi:hypothetical protein